MSLKRSFFSFFIFFLFGHTINNNNISLFVNHLLRCSACMCECVLSIDAKVSNSEKNYYYQSHYFRRNIFHIRLWQQIISHILKLTANMQDAKKRRNFEKFLFFHLPIIKRIQYESIAEDHAIRWTAWKLFTQKKKKKHKKSFSICLFSRFTLLKVN